MSQSNRYENRLLAILFFTWGTVFLDRMAQLYLAPYMIPDLHMTNEQVGFLASVVALTWAVSTVVFGAVSDRFGRRTVLIPAVFAFSLLSWLSGLVQTYEQMLVVRGLLGLAEGPCFSVIMATMEESSTPSRRGRNVGVVISAASLIGAAVAPVLTTQVAAYYGWRWAFFVAGIPGFILGILILLYVKESKGQGAGELLHAQRPSGIGDYFNVLRYRNMLLCCVAGAANLTWLFLLSVFGPLYITQIAHQAPTTAGFLLGATGFGSFFAGIIFPALSDRTGRKPMLMFMAASSAIIPLALLVPSLYDQLWLLAAIMFVFNMGQGVTALALVLVPTETVPPRLAATAIGLATMVAEVVGATVAPAIGGTLAVSYGLGLTLVLAAGGMAAVFVVALFLKETVVRQPAYLRARSRSAV
jgi:MFS family permease